MTAYFIDTHLLKYAFKSEIVKGLLPVLEKVTYLGNSKNLFSFNSNFWYERG